MKLRSGDLELAAEWLRANEGEGGEAGACHRVAEFLDRLARKRHRENVLRAAARSSGIPIRNARRILKEREGRDR